MSIPPPPGQPSGPPSGPLGPPTVVSPSPRRPWWRRPGVLIGAAAAAVVAAVVVALVLTRRGGESTPAVDTASQAREVAKRVALTPPDWGTDYVRSSPYEDDDKSVLFADADCQLVRQPGVNMLAYLDRTVHTPEKSVYATSTVIVYRNDGSAQADAARFQSDAQRCEKETKANSKVQWEDIRQTDITSVKGFDDTVSAEEGHTVTSTTGQKADSYYTTVMGRKGQFVLLASVQRKSSAGQNREDALNALSLMLSRL
ncbi:hypothetical protein JK359_09080 [Streptomyces actinomycinicus]|uniref:Uncharacterized protein n=1 Tax=Streptomyces actinomycinicus TaxID=1695166 RepID=A0A937JK50_9ACTN|nr:hypothetical protein [Streptomyces actinomycinicus]MBL1082134.1 hypothetical protein [Streptomyces actinomycinicus]